MVGKVPEVVAATADMVVETVMEETAMEEIAMEADIAAI